MDIYEYELEALKTAIESLKLYVIVSLFFVIFNISTIVYMKFHYLSSLLAPLCQSLFFSAIAFTICIIMSVLTINRFVTQLNEEEIKIYQKSVKYPNFIALCFFLIGLVLLYKCIYTLVF